VSGLRITGRATVWSPTAPGLSLPRGPGGLGLVVSPDAPLVVGADHAGTQLRFGDQLVDLRLCGTLDDAAFLLVGLARANVRALNRDKDVCTEAIRRVLSPPIDRCYVQGHGNGLSHDCTGESGFQYASDEEQQALEGCRPSDVWSDFTALLSGHDQAGRGMDDPVVCDCDDMGPVACGVFAWLAWFGEKGMRTPKGSWYPEGQEIPGLGKASRGARFAIAITKPPRAPIAHAYVLMSKPPGPPQPEIRMKIEGAGGKPEDWWVLDPAAHWGMPRPDDGFYGRGEVVAHELRQDSLNGLKVL